MKTIIKIPQRAGSEYSAFFKKCDNQKIKAATLAIIKEVMKVSDLVCNFFMTEKLFFIKLFYWYIAILSYC